MPKEVRIALDAMGGDNAPGVVLEGAVLALQEDSSLTLSLLGPADVVEPFAKEHSRVNPVVCTEVIGMAEHPAKAVRAKKDSTIVRGCELVRDDEADGFFSAGSTGACLAAATLVTGRIRGVKRPALGVVIPSLEKPTFLLDVGANADCKPEYLLQFAKMGQIYSEYVLDAKSPTVGLLNIGEEDSKGSTFAQEANALLREKLPAFAGNCEGKDLAHGGFDVVVTDGFTGNVALKSIEGTASLLFSLLKEELYSKAIYKLGALLAKGAFRKVRERTSPDTYGSSPLLGIEGSCLVGHGSSNAQAIKSGILTGCQEVRSGIVQRIEEKMSEGE